MKIKVLAILLAGFSFSALANGPETAVRETVKTYIENYLSNDYDAMKAVLHNGFKNQGINRDGSLSTAVDAKGLKTLMQSQDETPVNLQNNQIEIVSVQDETAVARLVTGPENSRWKEDITLEKVRGAWKIKKIVWSF